MAQQLGIREDNEIIYESSDADCIIELLQDLVGLSYFGKNDVWKNIGSLKGRSFMLYNLMELYGFGEIILMVN
jgi:hypothetical protein